MADVIQWMLLALGMTFIIFMGILIVNSMVAKSLRQYDQRRMKRIRARFKAA